VVGKTLPDARHKPRLYLEFNRASGDSAQKDGSHGMFDSLFPSSHDKYGLTDLFCSSNIVHLRPGIQYKVLNTVMLGAAYDDFWLANPRDGLYVSAKSVARDSTGKAGSHVGREGDLQLQWTLNRSTQVMLGYGRLFPGEFLRRTTAGVPYNIFFISMAEKF